jgi:hypothetical protein
MVNGIRPTIAVLNGGHQFARFDAKCGKSQDFVAVFAN